MKDELKAPEVEILQSVVTRGENSESVSPPKNSEEPHESGKKTKIDLIGALPEIKPESAAKDEQPKAKKQK